MADVDQFLSRLICIQLARTRQWRNVPLVFAVLPSTGPFALKNRHGRVMLALLLAIILARAREEERKRERCARFYRKSR